VSLVRLASRWIAGESLEDALRAAKRCQLRGWSGLINYLGEHASSKEKVEANLKENLKIVQNIAGRGLCMSVKLTQLGLDLDREYCQETVEQIAAEALQQGVFVWIDMEGSNYTQDTLNIFSNLHQDFKLGVAIQANLRRSRQDLEDLIHQRAKVRLVKGAYREKAEIAYTKSWEIERNFARLMETLFFKSPEFALATHDDRLINHALELNEHFKRKRKLEFQFLLGVRNDLKPPLASRGWPVIDYIPYGREWLAYTFRRIRERKRNILLLLPNLTRG